MNQTAEKRLWEMLYALRLRIGRLEGKLNYSRRGEQISHIEILSREILVLPEGLQREAALSAFLKRGARCEETNQLLRSVRENGSDTVLVEGAASSELYHPTH